MYEEDFYSDYDLHDDNDYERDTFYALTDGMYGDYEDFCDSGADFGSLMDSLGY